jgi:hypothetical protein
MSLVDNTSKERKRRERRRRNRGLILLTTEVTEVAFIDRLIDDRRIPEHGAFDRSVIAAAASRILEDFAAGRLKYRD